MKFSGIFITLYDKETLALYLEKGVYGFLMSPLRGEISPYSKHYNALADYACVRHDSHVFFFLKRRIYYGGQILGSAGHGAFYLNGNTSPIGEECNAPLVWDESERYEPTKEPGVFLLDIGGNKVERAQPYIILFEDKLGMRGLHISSDRLYFELGKYGFPLPSNSIQNMGFCTLTPGEVDILLKLLNNEGKPEKLPKIRFETNIADTPKPFSPELGIMNLRNGFEKSLFVNEAHLEFSIISNPNLLPNFAKPKPNHVICRQVPISPFKPFNMDRADICYYSSEEQVHSMIPNTVIELKNTRANNSAIKQVVRYLDWLHLICENNEAENVRVFVLAPSFTSTIKVNNYEYQIELISVSS